MIDPFAGIDSPDVCRRNKKELRWLNIFGDNKSCKTSFLVSLQERLRVVHLDFDCEGGTKMQIGTFLECPNLAQYEVKMRLLVNNLATVKPQIIVCDPVDRFYDMLENKHKADNGLKNIEWDEWRNVRNLLSDKMRKLMKLAPLLITTHSIRVSAMGKDDKNITYHAMDIPAGTQKWIQGATDANLYFYWDADNAGKPYPAFTVKSGEVNKPMCGSRDENLYDGMHTLDELRQYIFAQFGVADEQLKLAA